MVEFYVSPHFVDRLDHAARVSEIGVTVEVLAGFVDVLVVQSSVKT